MKVSRRMQRQVEIKIRHAMANEIPRTESPMTPADQSPRIEKAREESGSGPR